MSRPFRVLMVDDEELWLQKCKTCLSVNSIHCEYSSTVDDAIAQIKNNLFDLIFCDYKIKYTTPQLVTKNDGGYYICKQAKQYIPHIKIVIVTAFGSESLTKEWLVTEKFDDCINKSIDPEKDIRTIQNIIKDAIQERDDRLSHKNPFSSQKGHLPSNLINRLIFNTSEYELLRHLDAPECQQQSRFLITGPVGIGKSCQLALFGNYAQKLKHTVLHYEVSQNQDPPRTAIRKLLNGFSTEISQKNSHNTSFSSAKISGFDVSILGFDLKINLEDPQIPPDSILSAGITSIINKYTKKDKRLIFLIDDIQNLDIDTMNFLFDIFLKSNIRESPVTIGGSYATSNQIAETLNTKITQYFAGNIYPLKNFSQKELNDLIDLSLFRRALLIDRKIIEKIFQFSQGHPYLSQLLLKYTYDSIIEGTTDSNLFEKIPQRCTTELTSFFCNYFSAISSTQLQILKILISNGASASREVITEQLMTDKPDCEDIDATLSKMKDDQILNEKDGHLSIRLSHN